MTDAAQGALGTAQDLSQRPYTPYSTDPTAQVAQPGQDTLNAYQGVRDLQGSTNPQFQQAYDAYGRLVGSAAPVTTGQLNQDTSALYQNYQNTVGAAGQGLLGGYLQGGPMTAGDVTNNAQTIMSGYNNVTDPTTQLMRQQLGQNLGSIGAAANQAGAFGGSRQGVMEGTAQAQAALGSEKYIGDLLNSQWNNAVNTGYNVGNLASTQGYNAAAGLTSLGQQGYQNAQTQAGSMANTNLQAGIGAAGALPQLAVNQAGQTQKELSLLQTIGAAQQQQDQANINANIGQYYEGQNWPVQNLDILLSALGGVPYGSTTSSYGSSTTPLTKNTAAGVLGGAASGASIGAVGGPIGIGIGAVAGGILGALAVTLAVFTASFLALAALA